MFSHWFGWFSVVLFCLAMCSYFGRHSRNQKIKHFFCGKHHQIYGKLMIIFVILHGIAALLVKYNNFKVFIALDISGILCLFAVIFLWITFNNRKQFKQKWFKLHKLTAILLIFLIMIHLGIYFSY